MGVELEFVFAGIIGSRRLHPSEFMESRKDDEAMLLTTSRVGGWGTRCGYALVLPIRGRAEGS